jgi:hypothetical protein
VSSPFESATLLLRLYELRREPTMREARTWFALRFNPTSIQEFQQVTPQENAYFRMVSSYWDMAASFVLNGAIDEKMFSDANGEYLVVYSKIEPFIGELRSMLGSPNYLANLQQVAERAPDAQTRMAALRERFRAMAAARPS